MSDTSKEPEGTNPPEAGAANKPRPKRKEPADPALRWLQPSPVYVDHVAVGVFSGARVMRLVFGEWIDRETLPIYRAAVVLPLSEARVLAESLADELKEYDERVAKRNVEKKE